jgi:Tetratricopeptide repeat
MKVRVIFLSLLFFFSQFALSARAEGNKVFDFDARCEEAYQQIMATRLEEGRRLLTLEKQQNPDNLIPYFLDNYIDLLQLFFTENQDDYNTQSKDKNTRLDMMNEGDKSSPWYLYTKAVIHFQWSIIKIKFGERWEAAWEFRKAFLMLKQNKQKFPEFTPDDIYLGAMQTAIGTIPNGYHWITGILGLSGSISKGMQTLQEYIDDDGPYSRLFRNEAYFYYCYLKFYIERKPDEAFAFIKDHHLDIHDNQLYAFMVVNLAINHQMGNYALQVMQQRETGPQYMYFPTMDFELGTIYLDRLNLDSSFLYFNRYVTNFKGNFYVKDALQRISWIYYLEGNQPMAEKYRLLVIAKGSAVTDADKSALQEAQQSIWPDKTLLQSRLLSDGGYYQRALQLLNQKSVTDFSSLADKIEYAYRLGRIYDELGKPDDAMPFYKATIKGGKDLPQYYAARAAWQIGMIYEKRGDKTKAIDYYNQCLDMHEDEYKNSLDQWAKAGIDRLNGE